MAEALPGDSDDEYVLSDEVRVVADTRGKKVRPAVPPPPPRAGRSSQAEAADAPPVAAATSVIDTAAAAPALPSATPPPLPPKKPRLVSKAAPQSVVPQAVEHAAPPEASPAPVVAQEQTDTGDEGPKKAAAIGSHMRKERKQNRMSQLLDRLTPRRSNDTEELVISGPSSFEHRGHGEEGLAQLRGEPEEGTGRVECSVRAVALWSFAAAVAGEISLKAGEEIMLRDRQDEADWWLGLNKAGELGWIPANIIRKL